MSEVGEVKRLRRRPLLGGGAAVALAVNAERVAGFRLEKRLGEGGQGEVWLAEQEKMDRMVALKFLKIPERVLPEERWQWLANFQMEARVLGSLNHAGLVRLIDFKDTERGPCLEMEYVEGRRLDAWLHPVTPPPRLGGAMGEPDQSEDLGGTVKTTQGPGATEEAAPDVRLRVTVVEKVARALAEAHAQGVVHRDLKPANILVREGGEPVVVDFGLAGPVESLPDLEAGQRWSGGTPGYMAPEQGRMRPTAKMDIYSLGAVLFEALSGQLPGRAAAASQTIRLSVLDAEAVRAAPAVKLRSVAPEMPKELEAICARALATVPDERYSAMAELAEDLRRWRMNEPLAVETMLTAWTRRWRLAVRRRPWSWTLGGLALAASVVAAVRMFSLAQQRQEALDKSRVTEADSLAAVAAGLAARGKLDEALPDVKRALELDPQNDVAHWLSGQALVDRMPLVRVGTAEFVTDSTDSYHYAVGRGLFYAPRRRDRVLCRGTVSADGGRVEVQPWPSVWPGCAGVALTPDERSVVAVFADGVLRAWDAETGAERWPALAPREGEEQTVRISLSGRLVVQSSGTRRGAVASTSLRVVALGDGRMLRDLTLPCVVNCWHLALTHDDRWLVTGGTPPGLRIVDLADGRVRDVTSRWMDWKPDSAGAVYYVCPLQESARVLLGGQCRGLRVACLNAETGAFEWDREVLGRERRYTVGVEDIKLVPGAELFAVTGSEGDVMLHRLADGMPASGLMACPVRGRAIRFAGVDRLVLAGLRTTIWNWRTAERLTMPVPADFIPVGEALFLAPGKERLEVWRLEGQMPRLHDFKLGRGRTGFDLSADGRRALLAGDDGQAQWVDMETLTTLRILRNCAPEDTRALRMVRRPRVSADGTRAVVWVDAQTLALHDVGSTAEAGARVVRLQQPVMCAALSPDGRRLALGLEDGTWELRDAASGELQRACSELSHPPPGHGTNSPARGLCMEFSPDGRRLAIGTDRWTTASLWDSETGMPVQEPFMCGHGVRTVRIGHDGVLWSADWQGECLRFVEPPYHSHTRPGAPARRPPTAMFHAPVADLALSADGKWMAAGSWNTAARIFDQATLTQQGPDLQHTGEVTSVDWSPDGKRLLTATAAGEVCIWDRPTGRRLFSWPRLGAVVQAAFALNGTRIVLAGMDGVVHVREVHGGGSVRGDLPALLDELAAVPK